MMFYFTHMCDVSIVLCYMYLCIVFSFCSSIILFALPTIILVYYGQHTIMRSANILCRKLPVSTDDTISVVDSYCLTDRTKDRATHSYKVTIRCDDVSNILSANFWPDRIGCRLFEKRSRDPATPVPKRDNNGDQA